jgi:uncharacterized membrane protein
VTPQKDQPTFPGPRRLGFVDDFKRFFLRGLATILPTLVTLWLLVWVWDFLWENIGRYIINFIRIGWYDAITRKWLPFQTTHYILWQLDDNDLGTRLLGVVLAIVLVYFIGVFVGNLIGLAFWRVAERSLMRIPLVRAIYPAVKQVTDFVLADRTHQFQGSRVVAVQPHEQNIWSIGLVTSARQWTLDAGPEEMMTVFIPSSPTSFSGYVLVVPRNKVIELPMTVEEALRLLVTGGLITPGEGKTDGRDLTGQSAQGSVSTPQPAQPPSVRLPVQPIPPPRPLEKIG